MVLNGSLYSRGYCGKCTQLWYIIICRSPSSVFGYKSVVNSLWGLLSKIYGNFFIVLPTCCCCSSSSVTFHANVLKRLKRTFDDCLDFSYGHETIWMCHDCKLNVKLDMWNKLKMVCLHFTSDDNSALLCFKNVCSLEEVLKCCHWMWRQSVGS